MPGGNGQEQTGDQRYPCVEYFFYKKVQNRYGEYANHCRDQPAVELVDAPCIEDLRRQDNRKRYPVPVGRQVLHHKLRSTEMIDSMIDGKNFIDP